MIFRNQTQVASFNLSWSAVMKILLAVILLYVIFVIKDIIIWFIFALVISVLFNYVIDLLEKKWIPRLLSTSVLYLGFLALLGFFIYLTAPLLLDELQDFIKNFPQYIKKIAPVLGQFGINIDLRSFASANGFMNTVEMGLTKASGSVANGLFALFGGMVSTVMVFALAFFMSWEGMFVERIVKAFSSAKHTDYLLSLWRRARKKISAWFITRGIGAVFVGLATYLVLAIFNVKYAFILALIAGLADLVPFVGPIVFTIAIFVVMALVSFWQAVMGLLFIIVIQQLENHILLPFLFKKFAGLSPVLVLVALAIGGKLWGLAGAILAMPLAGVIYEIIKDYLAHLRREENIEIAEEAEDNS